MLVRPFTLPHLSVAFLLVRPFTFSHLSVAAQYYVKDNYIEWVIKIQCFQYLLRFVSYCVCQMAVNAAGYGFFHIYHSLYIPGHQHLAEILQYVLCIPECPANGVKWYAVI